MLTNIYYYTLLVSNKNTIRYYIALAIIPSWGGYPVIDMYSATMNVYMCISIYYEYAYYYTYIQMSQ